jgi:hypothetical protein
MRLSLGTLLIQAGVASKEDIKDAMAEGQKTGERLGEVVIRKGLTTDELLAKLLAEQWKLPYAEADEITVDEVATLRISASDARNLGAQPVAYDGDTIVMAIAEPHSELFAEVERRIGEATYVVVSRSTMEGLLGAPLGPMYGEESDYELPTADDLVDADGVELDEPFEQAAADVNVPGEADRDHAVVPDLQADGLSSIDSALEEFDQLHGVTVTLGESLRSIRDQLVEQQAAIGAFEAERERDRETIRRLEEELASQDDLFTTLRSQAAALAETLGAEAASSNHH